MSKGNQNRSDDANAWVGFAMHRSGFSAHSSPAPCSVEIPGNQEYGDEQYEVRRQLAAQFAIEENARRVVARCRRIAVKKAKSNVGFVEQVRHVPAGRIPKLMKRLLALAQHHGISAMTCFYCERAITVHTYTLDHVIPKCAGGENKKHNLVPCCQECNTRKGEQTKGWFKGCRITRV